jgi:hypothetical protein
MQSDHQVCAKYISRDINPDSSYFPQNDRIWSQRLMGASSKADCDIQKQSSGALPGTVRHFPAAALDTEARQRAMPGGDLAVTSPSARAMKRRAPSFWNRHESA